MWGTKTQTGRLGWKAWSGGHRVLGTGNVLFFILLFLHLLRSVYTVCATSPSVLFSIALSLPVAVLPLESRWGCNRCSVWPQPRDRHTSRLSPFIPSSWGLESWGVLSSDRRKVGADQSSWGSWMTQLGDLCYLDTKAGRPLSNPLSSPPTTWISLNKFSFS
jgi:hypothetical protein